jgi:hypothetical protein
MKALVGQVTHLLALYYRRLNLNFMFLFVVLTDPAVFLSFLKTDANCFHKIFIFHDNMSKDLIQA